MKQSEIRRSFWDLENKVSNRYRDEVRKSLKTFLLLWIKVKKAKIKDSYGMTKNRNLYQKYESKTTIHTHKI